MIDKVKKNGLLIVIAIVVGIFLFIMNGDGEDSDSELTPVPVLATVDAESKEGGQQLPTSVVVDVKGEVNSPGVYEIDIDSRINDVIKLAGGFTADAEELHVNLAQKVQDEMTIIIPKIGEIDMIVMDDTPGSNKVKINNATKEEIETLSGIGPSKAEAIIKYRDEHGLFQVVEDLLNISGIGEKTLENIRDDIQVP